MIDLKSLWQEAQYKKEDLLSSIDGKKEALLEAIEDGHDIFSGAVENGKGAIKDYINKFFNKPSDKPSVRIEKIKNNLIEKEKIGPTKAEIQAIIAYLDELWKSGHVEQKY